MEGNIIFNFSNTIVENIFLFFGIFIAFVSFLSYVVACNYNLKRMLFSSVLISFFGIIFGSIGHYLFYYNDFCKLEPHMPYYFKICNIAFFKDNTIGFLGDAWMSDHGLILGFVFGCLVCSFMYNFNFYKLLDIVILPICVLLSTFRILDLFKVKNFGLPTEQSFGIIFPKIDYLPRHACMIYEFILILIVFFILIYSFKKINFNLGGDTEDGFLFFIGIFLIYVSKIVISTLKVQDNLMTKPILDFLKLGVDQALTICLLVLSLIFVIFKFPKLED